MFIGPVFSREVVIAPRRTRFYVSRSAYVSALLVLMCTAWLILAGTQIVRNVGDLARFGAKLFQILAPLQLAVAFFFSALLAASGVAQEKDRRTLVLLLLTNLSNSELVLGKLLASMLNVLVLVAASLPLFMLSTLFGGVSFEQIAAVFAVTLASALAAGSLGSTLALWRESTFQTLAFTVLALVFWLAAGEALARGVFGDALGGLPVERLAAGVSPIHAILAASRPFGQLETGLPVIGNAVNLFVLFSLLLTAALNGLAIGLVRVWNPSREARESSAEAPAAESIWGAEQDVAALPVAGVTPSVAATPLAQAIAPQRSVHAAPGKTRQVWDNPVLWREIRTWAYGRKILFVRLAYLLLFAASAATLIAAAHSGAGIGRGSAALALAPLFVLSLALINAQAVTSLTSERDVKALDLLLVTDLSAKEFVFGKLGGVLYNSKEMILLPLLLSGYLWHTRTLDLENLAYLVGGLLTLDAFAIMLGVHAGMIYENSRSAIGVSLGTLFFLFIGVATCMRMMIAFSGSFHAQLQPFLAFMLGGAVGLYLALGARNASAAIGVASVLCPIATFYAITSFWLGYTLTVFLVVLVAYGFTTAAMLIPAVFEFDVATGRTSSGNE